MQALERPEQGRCGLKHQLSVAACRRRLLVKETNPFFSPLFYLPALPLALWFLDDEERFLFFSLTTVSAAIVEELERREKEREKEM